MSGPMNLFCHLSSLALFVTNLKLNANYSTQKLCNKLCLEFELPSGHVFIAEAAAEAHKKKLWWQAAMQFHL